MADTVPGDTSTTTALALGTATAGTIDTAGDHDWYRITLTAGQTYTFTVDGTDFGSLDDSFLNLRDSLGTNILASDNDNGQDVFSQITYTALTSGTYFLDASGIGNDTGSFSILAVNAAASGMDPVGAFPAASGAISIGGIVIGAIDSIGDHDWYAITLTAGQNYTFRTSTSGNADDADTYLFVRDALGNPLVQNDDGGSESFSSLDFTPTTTGTYYLDVEAYANASTGGYILAATPAGPSSIVTVHTGGITFNLIFDAASSASTAAATNFRAGIVQAASILSSALADNITITFKINYDGTGGVAGASPIHYVTETYADVSAALKAHAPAGDTIFNALPTSIAGTTDVDVWSAEAKALGFIAANDTNFVDGAANFATDISATKLVGVALHELTHAMGRIDDGTVDIFDLFRFTAPNTVLVTDAFPAPASYFSIDGGNTILANFGQASDPSDFLSSGVQGATDTFNELYSSRTIQALSAVDLQLLVALGFHLIIPNRPPTFTAGALQTIVAGDVSTVTVTTAATDPDNDPLTYSIASNPFSGTVSGSAGMYIYTPNPMISGTNSFSITVSDGKGFTSTQTINITVNAVHITGDVQNNHLLGNAEANILDGGAGADYMEGRSGDDTYYVDNPSDIVFELAGQGHDIVYSSVSYFLSESPPPPGYDPYAGASALPWNPGPSEIERLVLTGSADLFASGNSTDNVIVGNSGNNPLQGQAGNDTLIGGAGNDTLNGGPGTDIAVFSGNRGDYLITQEGQGFRVTDQRAGSPDGGDLATAIEVFQFADGQVPAPSLLDVNHAPTFAASIPSLLGLVGTPLNVSASATDLDNDPLTYSAGAASHGSLSGGTNGTFTYTPSVGFIGTDNFIVTAADGHGGFASQTVNVTVTPPFFVMIANTGFAGEIGGSGTIIGTNAFQQINILNGTGNVSFDASFNRGGDIIHLPGNAGIYSVVRLGSSNALLSDGVSTITIPVGTAGERLVFDDGVRTLIFDSASASMKIGGQAFSTTATPITAPDEHSTLPTGIDPTAQAIVILFETDHVTLGGDYRVLGTNSVEQVAYHFGDLQLDGSFNRGGDTLLLPGPAQDYSAYRQGSSVVELTSAHGTIAIPVGTAGMTLDFAGDQRLLLFDPTSASVKIGGQAITQTSVQTAITLTPLAISIDNGPSLQTLDASTGSQFYTDNAAQSTNVAITGFTSDDHIMVTGATASQYSFTSSAHDLDISYNAGGGVTDIILLSNVLTGSPFVADYASAQAAIGFNFMTFA